MHPVAGFGTDHAEQLLFRLALYTFLISIRFCIIMSLNSLLCLRHTENIIEGFLILFLQCLLFPRLVRCTSNEKDVGSDIDIWNFLLALGDW